MGAHYISDGLLIHFLVIGTILTWIFFILYQRQLFHYLSAGFWAWSAFVLYFFITPLIQYYGNPVFLDERIVLTEGLPRMIWVTFFVAVGIVMFFWGYFRARPGTPRFGLEQRAWPKGTWIVIIVALLAAGYCLVTYRGAFGTEMAAREFDGGKHIGKVTGYETVLYTFAFFPIILLLARNRTRNLGLVLAGLFLAGKLNDPSDRFSAVSLFLAVSMIMTLRKQRKWPSILWIVPVLAFTLFLHARGHQNLSQFQESGRMTLKTSRYEVSRADGAVMLSTLYLKSYIHDQAGYTYGIPLVSAVLFGALPRKYFPWKDWMVEGHFTGVIRAFDMEPLMYGGKSTVIGDLYGFGGVVAVAGGMFIVGLLVRKLDGWLAPQAPVVVRALGIVWLSCLWMMIGSALLWSAAGLYIVAVPFAGVVLCAKYFGPAARRSLSKPKYYLQR